MAMVNTTVPITSKQSEEALAAIRKQYPAMQVEVIATTAFSRPVQAARLGAGERKVLFSASHHANEWITSLVLLKFLEDLTQAVNTGGRLLAEDAAALLNAATIYVVPMVDPDGVDLVVGAIEPGSQQYIRAENYSRSYPDIPFPDGWKANLNGVDLNLQYPAGWLKAREIKFSQGFVRPGPRDYVGMYPFSQAESRGLAAYTEEIDPDIVVAFHTQGKEIYWEFEDYFVPGAQALGEIFAQVSGYTLAQAPAASSYAGYKDWFIQRFRRPGYTIEAGLGVNPLPISQFDEIYRDNLPILLAAILGRKPKL